MSNSDKKLLILIAAILWVFLVFNTITNFSGQNRFIWEMLFVVFGSAALGFIAREIFSKHVVKEISKKYTIESIENKINTEKVIVIHSREDDLKIIEGIGPKIEELFKKEGIKTFKQLSETDITTMTNILEKAGTRFKLNNPKTWGLQANLAYQNKWQELDELKNSLVGGL